MEITEIKYPPILTIIDIMRSTKIWPDFISLTTFESLITNGRVYELSINGQFIGFFMLHSFIPGIQIQEDLIIIPNAQGKWATRGSFNKIRSIATKVAFEEFGVQRIIGYVDENNTRSIKLTERLGMKCEGRMRNANRINGEWKNTLIFSLLKDEA